MKPPPGHIRLESIDCPRCGETQMQKLDWNTSPPKHPEYAQAGHDLSDDCNVVRLGRRRDDPEGDVEVLEWRDAAGNLTAIDPDGPVDDEVEEIADEQVT